MDIKHSRRILILGKPEAGALDIVKDLTNSAPAPAVDGSIAGLTHEWNVKTAYYSANVPIWIDEISDVQEWKAEFMKEEAKEVVEAVGAWIYCFVPGVDAHLAADVEEALKSIQEVVEAQTGGYAGDAVMLAVAKGKVSATAMQAEQDDKCMEYGFEYIDYAASGTNEFGEKQGFERLKEALEANEWSALGANDGSDLEDFDFDTDLDRSGFAHEEAEMTAELFGMKAALNNTDAEEDDALPSQRQADQVDDLDRMMSKLLAVKEQTASLPEAQRKRIAAKAVREIMDENQST